MTTKMQLEDRIRVLLDEGAEIDERKEAVMWVDERIQESGTENLPEDLLTLLYDNVRKMISTICNRWKVGMTVDDGDPAQLTLDGFKRVQTHYKLGSVRKPVDLLTDDEVALITAQLRADGQAKMEHADQLERYHAKKNEDSDG